MNEKLDRALCAKYPVIFRDRHAPMSETAMCWGFACGDGWYPLIDMLCARLMRLSPTSTDIPIAVQVKEKFGGLRFYVNNANDAQEAVIAFAEALSHRICEQCGTMNETTTYTDGWHKTLCPSCARLDGRDPITTGVFGESLTPGTDNDLWGV